MAKRKKRKNDNEKKEFPHKAEIIGLILMLLSILGIGKYGMVGRLMSSFSVFLVGVGYSILLVLILILGGYMIIKQKKPNFLNSKLIGIYILSIGLLVLCHMEYIVNYENSKAIFTQTIDDLMIFFQNIIKNGTADITGGGIIGGGFGSLFSLLFAVEGSRIVSILLLIFGIVLSTGVSLVDLFNKLKDKVRERKEQKQLEVYDNEDDEVVINNSNEDSKIIISNIDEVKEIKTTKSEDINPVEIAADTSNYKLPPMSLLNAPKKNKKNNDNAIIEKNIETIEKTLKDFAIIGKVVEVHIGPTVTQYELELPSGTKVNKIVTLNKEIALALAKKDVRIQAPIPGKSTIGIEVANDNVSMVTFREIMEKIPLNKAPNKLLAALGKNIMGEVIWCEINKTPHMLVAGATGSGKSVCINGIICSILMRAKPDEVKMILVDPKKVELGVYNGIPHLMCPVVTDPKKANVALKKVVAEMDRRYEDFSEHHVRNIEGYNNYVEKKNKTLPDDEKLKKMPYIVVIVDELADLMLVAGKEVEASIMRITQLARAAGIHLIVATQRPSTNVITGVIKANIPSRIAFTVSSNVDSRTILDAGGAEKLLGRGDMLFLANGEIAPQRIQGSFITDEEIEKLVNFTVQQQKAQYDASLMNLDESSNSNSIDTSSSTVDNSEEKYDDPLYNDIVEFVITQGKASASLLQRRFKLGYNRAARIIDLLEERGIVGPQNGSKPREVLVKLDENNEEDE